MDCSDGNTGVFCSHLAAGKHATQERTLDKELRLRNQQLLTWLQCIGLERRLLSMPG